MKLLFLLFAFFLSSQPVLAQKDKIVVLIDPGHGGSDPGHLSANKNHLPEKDLNLLIAKKFGTYLEQNLKNVVVKYTRTDDSYPSLDDRVAKANELKADYFVSIHCNANAKKSVHGTESHVHSMSSKKAVSLAKELEKEFSTRAGRHSRGVKDTDDREHSLQVLKYTAMTSVLVECGFLTNEREANYLNTASGQDILASAIFRAFRTHIVKEHPSISFLKTVKETKTNVETANTGDEKGTFTIQIMSSKEPLNTEGESFKSIGMTVNRQKLNTNSAYKYLYTVGKYTSKSEAKTDLAKIQKNGFKDAYVKRLE